MTFSLHAIVLPMQGYPHHRAFFGKGQRSEDAVRTRLMPEHEGASIVLGPPIAGKPELAVRYLLLIEYLRRTYPNVTGHWYPVQHDFPQLIMTGAMHASAYPPPLSSSAEGLAQFRQVVGVDMVVMAAMMGIERTRVHRIEQGKSKFTFDNYRRLRYWAQRLDLMPDFYRCFPLQPIGLPVEATAEIDELPEAPERELPL